VAGPTILAPRLDEMRIVLIGRFACVSRRALVNRLKSAGARIDRELSRRADCVVVGDKTWHAAGTTRVPRGAMIAQILQSRGETPEVLPERRFLQRYPQFHRSVEADECGNQGMRESDPAIDSSSSSSTSPFITSFPEWKRAQHMARWIASGVSPGRVRRAIRQLGRSLPGLQDRWEQFVPEWDGGRMLLRNGSGRLVDSTGQLRLEESSPDIPEIEALLWQNGITLDLFACAVASEGRGELAHAAATYRELLRREGPDADVCFNLANVLTAQGRHQSALERLWQCVELSPRFAEAWHNLAVALLELQDVRGAERAFARALELRPELAAAQRGLKFVQSLLVRASEQSPGTRSPAPPIPGVS
jgi:hypothetical protein